MKVLLLTTAHNSMSQRAWVELTERGHQVSIELALEDKMMIEAVELYRPDLIIAPFLKKAIPESIWRHFTCIIVHPGIQGDRGPSSLDWAILDGTSEWGVTLLQAVAEMDAGDVWSAHSFPVRLASKSSLYRNEVLEAAMRCLAETVERFGCGAFTPTPLTPPTPLGVTRREGKGRLRPAMKQADRSFEWSEPASAIARKVRSADSNPGVLSRILGEEYYLFGAHEEDSLRGEPGEILAFRDDAVCFGTGDGALWISHLKRRSADGRSFKLPATLTLADKLGGVPAAPLAIDEAARGRTYREIRYEERGEVGALYFDFYNGAMSTAQCRKLREAFVFARGRRTKVIALMGGADFWSNGIHLNVIEAAEDPAEESWANINAIDDLIQEILAADSHLVISAMQGNAGAGGVILALSADRVYARKSVVLNPHYKGMGGLYGSEYWTYLLPRRVGAEKAHALTEGCLPLGAAAAVRMGLLDHAFDQDVPGFQAQIATLAENLARDPEYPEMLAAKRERRLKDEQHKPLSAYRAEELEKMREIFFGPDPAYHVARRQFVHKVSPTSTPLRLALHRKPNHGPPGI
jgi:putative two-component system protein, hydrogenase maturation factor HypX/HoxX